MYLLVPALFKAQTEDHVLMLLLPQEGFLSCAYFHAATDVGDHLSEKKDDVKIDVSAYVKAQWQDRLKQLQRVCTKSVFTIHWHSKSAPRSFADLFAKFYYRNSKLLIMQHLHSFTKVALATTWNLLVAMANLHDWSVSGTVSQFH